MFNENLKHYALACGADISKQLHKCETFLKWIFGSVLVLSEKKKDQRKGGPCLGGSSKSILYF